MIERYIESQILKDLNKKMVFVAGPRQVGKTTLAKKILGNFGSYLNWDISEHREKILKNELPQAKFLVLDEIHKYRGWRNFLKGLYDDKHDKLKLLITGSGSLDYYRFGGDSLQGRYHLLHMFPLTSKELNLKSNKELLDLLYLGGFPEPYFGASQVEAKRWSREYRTRLIREDLQSLERVEDLGKFELMVLRLPDLVGSPLSINSISNDIESTHKTISKYFKLLERFYMIFRIPPFGTPKLRAVKKEQKHYHFNWIEIKDESKAFENLVALHLLKWVQFEIETKGRELELRYFRDIDGREVDFVVIEDQKPILFIEAKWSDSEITKGLKYLVERFPKVEAWQISAIGKKDFISPLGIRVSPAIKFFHLKLL